MMASDLQHLLDLDRKASLGLQPLTPFVKGVGISTDSFEPLPLLQQFRILNGILKVIASGVGEEHAPLKDDVRELLNYARISLVRHIHHSLPCGGKSSDLNSSSEATVIAGAGTMVILAGAEGHSLDQFVAFVRDRLDLEPIVALFVPAARKHLLEQKQSRAWYPRSRVTTECRPTEVEKVQCKKSIFDWSDLIDLLRRVDKPVCYLQSMPLIPSHVVKQIKAPIINLHNGLLPWIRGMDSPAWSLLAGVPFGLSMHRVDEGVDTGQILWRETVNPLTDDSLPTHEAFQKSKISLFRAVFLPEGKRFRVRSFRMPHSQPPHPSVQFYSLHETLRTLLDECLDKSAARVA